MQRGVISRAGMAQLFIVAIVTLAGFAATPSYGGSPVIATNEEAKKAVVQVQPLKGDLSVLEGSGGNITVLNGPKGKFLVDGGIAYSKDSIIHALQTISNAPPLFVLNTHYHWDHTDSNVWLHELGATIMAHPNTLKHLSASTRVDDWEFTFPPMPASGRPTDLISKNKTMKFNGTTKLPITVSATQIRTSGCTSLSRTSWQPATLGGTAITRLLITRMAEALMG